MVLLFVVLLNGVSALEDTNQTVISTNDMSNDAIAEVANVEVVNDSSPSEVLTAGEGSFTDLQSDVDYAINNGGVLTLTRDYVYDKVNDVSLRSGVVINAPLTIIGDNHTISGGDSLTTINGNVVSNDGARIFNIDADDVTITNVNFKNGCLYYRDTSNYATYQYLGAGIYWKGNDGVVDGCTFKDMVKYYNLDTTSNTRADCVGLCIYHAGGCNFTVRNSNFSTSSNLNFQSSAVYGTAMTGNFSIIGSNFNHFYQMFESRNGDILTIKDCNFTDVPGEAYLWAMYGYLFNYIDIDNTTFNFMHAKNAGRTASNVMVFNSKGFLNISNSYISTSARWGGTTIQGSEVYIDKVNFTNCASGGGETNNIVRFIGNNRATASIIFSECYFYDLWSSWYWSYWNSVDVSDFNSAKVYNTSLRNYAHFYFYDDNDVEFCYNNVSQSTRELIAFNNVINAVVYNNTFDNTSQGFHKYGINLNNVVVLFENNTFSNMRSVSTYDTGIFLQSANTNVVFNKNVFQNFYNTNMQGLYGIFQLTSNVNCNFTNNIVDDYSAIGVYSRGLFSNEGHLLLFNNTFSKCRTISSDASGYGGVIYNLGTVIADNNNFSNVHSDYGGAIYTTGDVCTLTNNTFDNCYATVNCGVCYTTTTDMNFINNTITNCYSNGDVGALSINSVNNVFNNNTFINVSSTNKYGAILSEGINNTFMYNTFTNITSGEKGSIALNTNNSFNYNNFTNINTSGEAGVFYIYGDDCNITNTIIINSTSVNDGGAIYSTGNNLNITNITINGTKSNRGFGGALYSVGLDLYITNMSVFDSYAYLSGGVLYSLGANVNMSNINLVNTSSNSSGGAIYCDGNEFYVYDINITNSSSSIGGAIYCQSNNVIFDALNVINSTATTGGVLYIVGNNVIIINSTFTDCTANTGGAIYSTGSYGKLYNLIFNNINATNSGGALFWTGINANFTKLTFNNITSLMGGAIYGSGTDAYFNDIIFDNVSALNSGGAIYWTGNDALLDTIIFRNVIHSGASGGAIYWTGDRSRFKNMKFDNVTSDANGGCIYSSASNCDLTNITFTNCSSDNSGGAIYWTGSNTNMSHLDFNNINATIDGGAISLIAGNCKIYESNFTDINAGNNGGAIYLIGDSSTLYDLNISYCNAKCAAGGAIYFVSSFSNVYNIYCLNNTAATDGGAIYFDGQYSKLYDSYFVNNTAFSNGGAISWVSLNGTLYDVNLTGNNALKGGALYWTANSANISFVNFTDNKASSDGGALFMGGFSSSTVYNSSFVNNSAENGGSVYWLSNDGVMKDSIFNGSSAANGGIIYWVGGNGNLLDVEFSGANASNSGGILFVEGNYLSFNNSILSDSSAISGGAVYWIGHYGSMNNITFINNTATSGGAFYLLGSDFELNNCTLLNNTANSSGGAVYWGGSGNILKSIFTGNKAYSGSAIFNFASMYIKDSSFLKNKANISSIEIETKEEEQSFNVSATVYAADNFLNAIWTTSNNIEVNNVTYWDGLNVNNTGDSDIIPSDEIDPSSLYYNSRLAYTNITIIIRNNKNGQENSVSGLTDINGTLAYSIPKSETTYNVTALHNEDDYYFGFSNSVTGFSGGYTASITPLLSSYSFDYYSPISIMAILVSSKMGQAAIPINGTVHIYVDDEYLADMNVTNAMGTLNTILLNNAGEHNLTMKYDGYGDENMTIYPCVSPTIYFTINRISLPLSVSVNSSFVAVDDFINIKISSSEGYVGSPIRYVIGNVETFDTYVDNYNVSRSFTKEGTVNVLVYAEGDVNFLPNVAHVSFNVIKNDINIEILNLTGLYLDSINVGDSATINIKLDANDSTGNVIVNINDKDYIAPINGEYASVTIYDLESGFYPIIAKYYGDGKYLESNVVSAILQVNKIDIDDISVICQNQNILVGQEGMFDITVNPNSSDYKVNGFVTVKINNKEFNVSIVNNTGSFIVSNLEASFYSVDVVYGGNAQFNSMSKSDATNITVNKVDISDIEVEITNNSILVGQDAVYNINIIAAEVGYAVNGFVTVTVNGKDYNVSISNGKGSLTVSNLPKGEYFVDVDYAGDSIFNNYSVTNLAKVEVNKLAIRDITVTARNNSIFVGQNAVYDIVVTADAVGYVVNGYVAVNITDKLYNVSISNGEGLLSVPGLTKGSYYVDVYYPGDEASDNYSVFNQANVVVSKVNIKEITVTSNRQNILVGKDAILNISVVANESNYFVNGFVTVKVGNHNYNVSIVNGNGSLNVSGLLEGEYFVDVIYGGDETFNEFTVSNKYIINSSNVNIREINVVPYSNNIFVGQDAVYNITVIANDGYVVNGFVTVSINGKNYNVSIINGNGSFSVSGLYEGNYSVNITYARDNTFNEFKIINKGNISVKKVGTSISITPTSNNILVGEDAVYTINVNPDESDYIVNGFVTVKVNGKNYNVSIVNGKGSLTVSGLQNGTYFVNVTYAGDSTFYSSNLTNVGEVNVSVISITGIVVTPERSSIYVGEDAVLNVEVMSSKFIVNGYVTIYVDSEMYNVSIANGKGSLILSNLNAGNHVVYVSYDNDGTFNEYNKTRVTSVNVNKVDVLDINITAQKSSIFVGESANYTINITVNNDLDFNDFVTVRVNNKEYNVSITEGIGYLAISDLPEGIYSADVSYAGSDMYNAMYIMKVTPVSVNKVSIANIEVSAQKSSIYVGQNAVYNIVVTAGEVGYVVNGSVTVKLNNNGYVVPISNGMGSLNVSGLANGSYTVDVSYSGDNTFNGFNVTDKARVDVNKVNIFDIVITPKSSSISVGQNAIYDIVLNPEVTGYIVNGSVTVKLNNKEYVVPIYNNKGYLNVSGLSNGIYTLDVNYTGDDTFNPTSKNTTAQVSVNKVDINNIDVKVVTTPIYVGQNASYIINITSRTSGYVVNGFVTIKIDKQEQNVSISNGIGRVDISNLAEGSYTINVSYAGDDTFNSFNVTGKAKVVVNKVDIREIAVTPKASNISVGQNAVYDIVVTADVTGYVVNGFVTVSNNIMFLFLMVGVL